MEDEKKNVEETEEVEVTEEVEEVKEVEEDLEGKYSQEVIQMLEEAMEDSKGRLSALENSIASLISAIPVNEDKVEVQEEEKTFDDYFKE